MRYRIGNSNESRDNVRNLYQTILNRAPDTGGFEGWVAQLASGATTFTQVRYRIGNSNESRDNVRNLYQTILNRAPDTGGFEGWVAQLASGAATFTQVRNSFINSPEAKALQQVGKSGYYRELSSLTESQWDQQSGDDNQFRPDSPYGGGNQQSKTDDRVRQIYTDLASTIFGNLGYSVKMTSGYAYDQSYYNKFRKWHAGLDLGASNGATIKAAIGGSVAWVSGSGDGNIFVGINSDDGRQWVYGHLKSASGLSVGKRINAGAIVSLVGAQNHLHLEVENGFAYGATNGAMTDRNKLLSVTVSPLMAYWQWRNKNSVTPTPTPFPTPTPSPTPNFSPSISIDHNSSGRIFRDNTISISGNSNTSSLEFYIGDRRVEGSLKYLTDGAFTANLDVPDDLHLGSYAVKVVAKNQFGSTERYGAQMIDVVDYSWKSEAISKDGKKTQITFEGVNNAKFIENKPTWLLIHGWNGKAGDFRELAGAIEEYDGIWNGGDYQVLTVDWEAARTGIAGLKDAASWIDSVAEAIKNTIKSWGISLSNINLVGHSFGAYIAYEVSERLAYRVSERDADNRISERLVVINNLVALNPATTTADGYNLNQVNFSGYSTWSWAFWHNNTFDGGNQAVTAHESFVLDLPFAKVSEGHGAAKVLWTNMLRDRNGSTSSINQYFGLEDMTSTANKPWGQRSGWEARIRTRDNRNGIGDPDWVATGWTDPGFVNIG